MKNKTAIFLLILLWGIVLDAVCAERNEALKNNALADEAYRAQNYYSAIEYYKASLQINPEYTDALYGLSRTYFKLNEYREALKYLLEARKIDAYETSYMVLEGRIDTALGRYADALRLFQNSLKTEPNNTAAELGMAELFVAEGDILNALKIYNKTLKYLPDDRRTLLSLVIILDEKGRFSEADKYVSHLLRLYPNDSMVQYTAASHFLAEGKTDQIEVHAAAAVALDKNNQKAVLLLTKLYVRQQRYEEAALKLQQVLKNKRDQPLVWYMLAEVYRMEKDNTKALQSYAIAVHLDADDELLRIALENFIISHTSPNDRVRDRYAEYHFKNGQELENRNYLRRAKEEYRRGLIIAPHSDKGWLLYARLLKRSGYRSRYLSILKQIFKNRPHDRELKDKIEIYESLLSRTVASKWKINQFEIEKPGVSLGVYSSSRNMLSYINADYYINCYVKDLLQGTDRISVSSIGEKLKFAEAFNKARKKGCNYFMILTSKNGESTFSLSAKLYHGKTGALLKSFSLYRTGNDRVVSALMKLSSSVQALIPLEGKIIQRKFNTALIDLGLSDGIAKGTVFHIVDPAYKPFINERFAYVVDKDHILGEITVTAVDDLVAEGTIKKDTFFDRINTGDILIPVRKGKKTATKEAPVSETNTPPSDIYKTILTLP